MCMGWLTVCSDLYLYSFRSMYTRANGRGSSLRLNGGTCGLSFVEHAATCETMSIQDRNYYYYYFTVQ